MAFPFITLKKIVILKRKFLLKKSLFLHVYEQHDKFGFFIKKSVKGKNDVLCDHSLRVTKNVTVTTY